LQDRLDGGIYVLLRCPGSIAPLNLAVEKISVDLYITPHELIRNERISGDTAMLIQVFCQEFALPHLQRFTERCSIESMRIPRLHCKSVLEYPLNFTDISVALTESISLKGPNHLPAFLSAVGSRIQCTALSANTRPDVSDDMRHLSPSAAIRESAMLTPSPKVTRPFNAAGSVHQLSADVKPDVSDDVRHSSLSSVIEKSTVLTPSAKNMHPLSTPTSVHQCTVRQRRPADAFLYMANEKLAEPIPPVVPPDLLALHSPLISLGPNTDAVLDRFSLGDELLPRLHILVKTVRSSRWEAVLRVAPWNLTYNVSQSVDLGQNNNPNTTPTKDYEKVQVVVYLHGVQRGCAEEGERGSTPTG